MGGAEKESGREARREGTRGETEEKRERERERTGLLVMVCTQLDLMRGCIRRAWEGTMKVPTLVGLGF